MCTMVKNFNVFDCMVLYVSSNCALHPVALFLSEPLYSARPLRFLSGYTIAVPINRVRRVIVACQDRFRPSQKEMHDSTTTPCRRVCSGSKSTPMLCMQTNCKISQFATPPSLLFVVLRILRCTPLVHFLSRSQRISAASLTAWLSIVRIVLEAMHRSARPTVPLAAMGV